MKRHLPLLAATGLVLLLLLHGPIAQPEHYHRFADARSWLGLPNAADVLSNIGFAVAGLWGWIAIRKRPATPGHAGYLLFTASLVMTAAGSFYYHLQPDDARLVWDRIPIALACAGLLAAVHGDATRTRHAGRHALLLGAAAIGSVFWWRITGDLRPYLLFQALPLVLIPLWQWIDAAPREERACFAAAIALYIAAKAAELHDHEVMAIAGWMSGHTLKHLLATAAAFAILAGLTTRTTIKKKAG